MPSLKRRTYDFGRMVTYRIAGLPVALRASFYRPDSNNPAEVIRAAYARQYWRPRNLVHLSSLLIALILWPFALIGLEAGFIARNGGRIAAASRRPRLRQVLDQTRLYFSAGVLPPWYYVFELHRNPAEAFARGFIYRWESKGGVLGLLKDGAHAPRSVLTDKREFAQQCHTAGIPTAPVIASVCDGSFERSGNLDRDLFVKPLAGRGGKGAERWDFEGGRYRNPDGRTLTLEALVTALEKRSLDEPLIVQPRLVNHPALASLSNGALSTVRVLTCLDEHRQPELVGAAMRMAIGSSTTVDNLHAGGIAAAVNLNSGALGRASDLGTDCRLGWMDRHPISRAAILGATVPAWPQIKALALSAHRAFSDRVLIGWDIAATADGPVVVEGNGAPDLDIMQRFIGHGLMAARLGILLAFHLSQLDIDQLPM